MVPETVSRSWEGKMDFCQLEDRTDSTPCGHAQETRGSLISDMGVSAEIGHPCGCYRSWRIPLNILSGSLLSEGHFVVRFPSWAAEVGQFYRGRSLHLTTGMFPYECSHIETDVLAYQCARMLLHPKFTWTDAHEMNGMLCDDISWRAWLKSWGSWPRWKFHRGFVAPTMTSRDKDYGWACWTGGSGTTMDADNRLPVLGGIYYRYRTKGGFVFLL